METHNRFLNKISVSTNGCWNWTATKNHGYGMFWYAKRNYRAHRYSYEYYKGVIPKELTIDHMCNNKACVNPDHLQLATMRENVLRNNGPSAKNAVKTHCKSGHPLKGENLKTRIWKGRLERTCLTCMRRFNREWKKRVHYNPAKPKSKFPWLFPRLSDYQQKIKEIKI